MIKKIILFILIVYPVLSFAQVDTNHIEQYCKLIVQQKSMTKKVTVRLDFGDEQKFFSDNRLHDEEGSVEKFNTEIDALNYMGKQGWILVFVKQEDPTSYTFTDFYFKKTFLKSELGIVTN